MKTFLRVMVLASVLLLLATSIDAQSPTGYLIGYVRSGDSPLQGATVKISSPALQGTRSAVTDVNGYYIFTLLPPGEYTLHIEHAGMRTVNGTVQVLLTTTSRFDANLIVSELKEEVTVEAERAAVTQTPQVATNLSGGLTLSLIGPTDPIGAATLAPGVIPSGDRRPSISGGPGFDNLVLVNGMPAQGAVGEALGVYVEDALQETTVLTGAIPAEYGRFSGGVITAITKSGGNQFSGSIRNSLTNASWAANRPGEDISVDKINPFYGATLGGYVLRDRLWFFGAARDEVRKDALQTWRTNLPFSQTATNRRYETKLTAALTANQNLAASYFDYASGKDNNFFPLPIYEFSTIGTDRKSTLNLMSVNYNGVFGPKFLMEAHYAVNDTTIQYGGGLKTSDLAAGSYGWDMSAGAMFNAPVLCGDCGEGTRRFESGEVKGTTFLASPRAGSHSIVAGATTFSEHMSEELHQSGTDFAVYANSVARPAGSTVPYLSPGGFVYPRIMSNRAYILWNPIFDERSKQNDLNTRSLYANDRWDFSSHFTFNVGVRYDRTHAEDANGHVTSDDGAISPRLTAVYDPLASGRHRVTAGYNRYVSKMGFLTPATALETAGIPSSILFVYRGPSINPAGTPLDQLLDSRQAFQQAFAWLASVAGGTSPEDLTAYMQLPGAAAFAYFYGFDNAIPETLKATSVDEYVLGYGIQLGGGFYAKADYVKRAWSDFFGRYVLAGGPQKTDPFGLVHDVTVIRNTNDSYRKYDGVQFQMAWRPKRMDVGATYTYWTMKYPADAGGIYAPGSQYPELTEYPEKNPAARGSYQRAKAWVSYDVPLPASVGALNVGLVENFDTGAYYSVVGTVDPRVYAESELGDYAYSYSALGVYGYYFEKPNKYRLGNVTSTDLGVNYSRRLAGSLEFMIQGAMTNVFNEQEVVNVLTSVYTNADDAGIALFDPRKETPVEGVHWVKDENFGKPTGPSSYQPARTYNVSFGLRF